MTRWLLVTVLLSFGLLSTVWANGQPAVASAHPLATRIGLNILENGGNAFDAAVAVTAVLAVVEPYGSGLGGGGFWLLHEAQTGQDIFIDARETAPLASTADMYLDSHGRPTSDSVDGAKAAGIPGVPAAIEWIAIHYASQSLADLLEPAIRLADEGVRVNPRYRALAELRLEALRSNPAASTIFLDQNLVPDAEFILRQQDLAKTLRRMATHGAEGFYHGEIADLLVNGVQQAQGIWTRDDLAAYQIILRQPVVVDYAGFEMVMAPLPSSGGVVLAQSLNMLRPFDYQKLSSLERIHLTTEIMRRAYKTRSQFLGDADFAEIPLDTLLSKDYALDLIADFSAEHATLSADLIDSAVAEAGAGEDTTHFSIIDQSGNYVAATLSINYPFGSGFVAPGTGVILNNEMDDFAVAGAAPNLWGLVQSSANRIEPGKRMLSSMSPTFVRNKDQLLIVGTPGGSRIISMVLLSILDFVEAKPLAQIVAQRRYHHQFLPDEIQLEADQFDQAEVAALQKMGHQVNVLRRRYGDMHAILHDYRSGESQAASDPRGHGLAAVGEHR